MVDAPSRNSNGPGDVPLRSYVTDFPMIVCIYDLQTGNEIQKAEINYGNYEDRKWLGRLTYWACTNHYSVETMKKEDYNSQPKENKNEIKSHIPKLD